MKNREIKFRAWDKTSNCMDTEFSIHADGCLYQSARHRWDISDIAIETAYEDLEVMQFTGLQDKNGKEIYEGDIILYNRGYVDDSRHDFMQGHNYEIIFKDGKFMPYNDKLRYQLGFDGMNGKCKNYEVIGNIYQNPEFLQP